MATLPTGSNREELIFISTEKISVTFKGIAVHPRIGVSAHQKETSDFRITCLDSFHLEVAPDLDAEVSFVHTNSDGHRILHHTYPIFYEQQNYEIIIENNSADVIEFWHENLGLRNKISPVGRSGKMLSGIINFGNEIGKSDLIIRLNGTPYLTISVEVFPTKLQYRADYLQLMADVTDEIYNLSFEFLKKTYFSGNLNDMVGNSSTEFFSVIRHIYDLFITAADVVIAHPHHTLYTQPEILPAHKIRRSNTKTLRWLEKHPEHIQNDQGQFRVDCALATQKRVTYDTPENQFAKFILCTTIKRLETLLSHYQNLKRQKDSDVVDIVNTMVKGIDRRVSHTFFNNVSDFNASTQISMVFTMAPGYRELYKYYIMMQHGLSLDSDIFSISVKDVALLYEYWCFIKLNSILKERYHLIKQDIIKTDGNNLFITLRKGSGSSITYVNPQTGERIHLAYNPKASSLPTVTQRPDNVLSLKKKGSNTKYQYIFDAKYRINPALNATPYRATYQTPGPEEEDINTMHRYRDAIVRNNSTSPEFERTMFGAYVLFPYHNEEEYQQHKFYESIETVNVGGLPFLPSATALVAKMLDKLIGDSPDSALERATLPTGIAEKLAQIDLDNRDVMVGIVRNETQLTINLAHRFYHIPVKRVAVNRLPIHYVALYQPDNVFGKHNSGIFVYGEVIRTEKTTRKQITAIPHHGNPNDEYYQFFVKDWISLDTPIRVLESGLRVQIYTNLFLLKVSESVPELLIRSTEELRLYQELKRLSKSIDIDTSKDEVKSFQFNGSFIRIIGEEIVVLTPDGCDHRFIIDAFKKRPREVFGAIRAVVLGD